MTLIPSSRKYVFSFRDVASADKISVAANGETVDFTAEKEENGLSVTVDGVGTNKSVIVTVHVIKS